MEYSTFSSGTERAVKTWQVRSELSYISMKFQGMLKVRVNVISI